jgi:rhodanese-related sulfurtransferase
MAGVDELGPREAEPRLDEFAVIDVRAEHEFHGPLGRIRGARLLPLPELAARARELPRGRPLLLVCRSGARSGKACEQLAGLGIGPALNLAGGMIAWNRAGLPVERSEPGSLRELLEGVVAWTAQVSGRERVAVAAELAEALGAHDFDAPTRAGVERALTLVDEALRTRGAPPDLEPSLASFRRALAAL